MAFTLPNLPYREDALAPRLSKEELQYHHGKHHAAYVNALNELAKGNKYEKMTLEEIIKTVEPGKLFDQAAQSWNHDFYWHSMSPDGGGAPQGELADAIDRAFGDLKSFEQKFREAAVSHFGSGWAWLVMNKDGKLAIDTTHDAENPLILDKAPLLACDVWEHAYYIDYRNERPRYVETFLKHLVNWDFAASNMKKH
jgi:Fe-Mn family superoxide dismutase